MAHVEKFTRSATGHMCKHFERSTLNYSNENIDKSRTCLNYNLAPQQDQIEFIRNRILKVKCMKRKDVNVMCSWVVTIPKDFLARYPEKEKDFFKSTYKFLEQRYGTENVISAWVHKDEVTPHIHFAFIPVYHDVKKNINKVSAKNILNRHDLRTFHKDLDEYLNNDLKVHVGVLNGATANGNRTIEELKTEKLVEENKKLLKEAEWYSDFAERKKCIAITSAKQVENSYSELNNIKRAVKKIKLVELPKAHEELDSLRLKNEKLSQINAEKEKSLLRLENKVKEYSLKYAQLRAKHSEMLKSINNRQKDIDALTKRYKAIVMNCEDILNKFGDKCLLALEVANKGFEKECITSVQKNKIIAQQNIQNSISDEDIKLSANENINKMAAHTEKIIKHKSKKR